MTDAVLGHGTCLMLHDGSANFALANYVAIGEIREGPDEDESVAEVDVTHHKSPGRRREYIAGLVEGATLSMTCNYLPEDATQDRTTGLIKLFNDGTVRQYAIVEPRKTNAKWLTFDALITSKAITRPVDDAMQISFDMRKTGNEAEIDPPT